MAALKIFLVLAGLVCAAQAQTTVGTTTVATVATTARPWYSLTGILSQPMENMRQAVTAGASLKGSLLNGSLNIANDVAGGMIGAKSSLVNMGSRVMSNAVQMGTQAAQQKAALIANLLSGIPLVGQFANTGSRLVAAGANSVDAGLQTAIGTATAFENAALGGLKSGISAGTGLAGTLGNSAINMGKTAAHTGIDLALSGAGMVDTAVGMGNSALTSALGAVNGMADSVGTLTKDIAASQAANIRGATSGSGTGVTASGSLSVNTSG